MRILLVTLLGFISHLGPIAEWGLEFENKRQIKVAPSMETNLPGVYAAGDVRAGSTKRCAAAVGEGAMVVQFVHARMSRQEKAAGPWTRRRSEAANRIRDKTGAGR